MPDDEGHVHLGADDALGLTLVDDRQRIGTVGALQGRTHGGREIAVVGLLHEMGDGLGVGLGVERMAGCLQLGTQLDEVLDDAVVDDGQLTGAVHVGVGVEVVGPTVRGPACMAQTRGRTRSVVDQRLAQDVDLARALLDEKVAALGDQRDAGRVVATVLETGEALHEHRRRLIVSDVSDDPAHVLPLLVQSLGGERRETVGQTEDACAVPAFDHHP